MNIMNIFKPAYISFTTAAGAGAGLYISNLFNESLLARPSLTPVVVGAALGAVVGWAQTAINLGEESKPRRSPLSWVYKDLCKVNYRIAKRYKSNHTSQVVLAMTRSDNRPVILKLPEPTMVVARHGSQMAKPFHVCLEFRVSNLGFV